MNGRRMGLLVIAGVFAGQHLVERALGAREVAHEPPRAAARVAAAVLPQPSAPDPVEVIAAGALVIPVAGVAKADLRDDFGAPRGRGRRHTAIDILAPRGTPALAAVDGVILKLFESRAGGLTAYLADPSASTVYYYAHLDGYAPGITEGAEVEQGSTIGFVGTTGNAPRDVPHLHFGVERLPETGEWWKGEAVNPYPLLIEHGVTLPAR